MGSQVPRRSKLYIAGGPGGSSIGPKVHEYVASTLHLDWTCEFLQLEAVEQVLERFRTPTFTGGLVTMPHKRNIIPHLKHCDDLVTILGACNMVYMDENEELRGTNTDWVGIYESIMMVVPHHESGRIGMVYGAGGASRAAVYALWVKLECRKVYLINRDEEEVNELIDEVHRLPDIYWPEVIHVKTIAEARQLPPPYYTICTVPDSHPNSREELDARCIFSEFMVKGAGSGGVVQDMCYHPRMTRNLKKATEHGYITIQGQIVSAAQFKMQWKLWTGQDIEMKGVFEKMNDLVLERELLQTNHLANHKI